MAVRVILLPRDTNSHGTIFGGVLLSHIDLAGAQEARRHTRHAVVTVAMDRVEFLAPVYVGDEVSFYTRLVKTGRTSITVHVDVEAARRDEPGQVVKVTEADVVFVALNARGRKTPLGPRRGL